MACGHDHTLALTDKGVYSYGYGGNGRLGHGSEMDEKRPRLIEALQGKEITSVSCGGCHSAVLTSKGELYTWGWNHFGQLGMEEW